MRATWPQREGAPAQDAAETAAEFALRDGDTVAFMAALAPFGLLFGVAATEAGLGPLLRGADVAGQLVDFEPGVRRFV